jgi:hypothetical protein
LYSRTENLFFALAFAIKDFFATPIPPNYETERPSISKGGALRRQSSPS